MITFFRRIRQNLLAENRLGKYLLYAIGEIILVVIGILMALQINNWNEGRKINNQELELLISLNKEYAFNLDELNRSIVKAQRIQRNCEALLKNTGDHGVKLSEQESDSLISTGLLSIITYDVSNGILDDIINSGKIQILKNEKPKIKLSNWNGILNDVKEDEMWTVNARDKIIFPFMYRNSGYVRISQSTGKEGIRSGFNTHYSDIYKLQEFENLVNSHRIWNRKSELNYQRLKKMIEEIIFLCKHDIELKK